MNKLFTSEQVSCGHPDKICDGIADAILDACLEQDKTSRVAVEVLIKNYDVIIAGELTTTAIIDVEQIAMNVLKYIRVDNPERYKIKNILDKQSKDIALGVDIGGAGDQGIMFGFATDETKELMPLAWSIATKALKNLRELRHPLLKADAKCQVTIDYTLNRIDTFLISTQHSESASLDDVKDIVYPIMLKTAREYNMNTDFKYYINPTGRFVIGGSIGDAGVTGRKIICDTYGGYARHGGGAFSGKDPSKVDRSAAYMARKIAKDIVRKKFANKCEIQLSYGIGIDKPLSINVNTFGTGKMDDQDILNYISLNYDLTPKGIIDSLDLLNTHFFDTTFYGHFGKENLNWEK